MLLIPTFLLLISPVGLTAYLCKNTKHSATILKKIYSFGEIFRVLNIFGFFFNIGELLRFL